MIVPYSIRRRKNTLGTLFLLVSFIYLVKRYSLSISGTSIDDPELSCLEYFTMLEEKSKDWSNRLYKSSNWPSSFPLGRREGDDAVENVVRLKNFQKCLQVNQNRGLLRIAEVEKKLFPYLDLETLESKRSNFWPIYQRWTGDVYENSVPRFSQSDNHFIDFKSIDYDAGVSFWENWLENVMQSGSKGIVISVGDFQVADAIRLIRVLRYLKNDLPIEIVHKGDLNRTYQDYLVSAARDGSSDDYPSQELWFLDVLTLLKPEFTEYFTTYSNKWLSVMFSSFENPILLDADTIPFVPLERYYESEQFKSTGTMFFKDRKLSSDPLNETQLGTLKKIVTKLLGLDLSHVNSSPSLHDQLSFHMKDAIAVETIENMFTKGYRHHMESGLLVIDKRRHLFSLLTSISLQFSSIRDYFHGDKEWFWIALFLRNDTFTFHPKDASNSGNLGSVISDGTGEYYQICSVQLSHTDFDGSLLWINGGLSTCKKSSWDYDYKNDKRISAMFDSAEKLKEYYQSPVELEGAIIPNVNIRPWIKIGECAAFSYCTLYKEGEFGEVLKFNDSEKQRNQKIVRIWNSPL